jgi:uncharacterized membrane protein
MNRQEFMKRLEELLTDISTEEKEEALAYYTGYFEDAGEENEEKIIQELESPERLAASIKAGLREDGTGEYTERGYRMSQEAATEMPLASGTWQEKNEETNHQEQQSDRGQQDGNQQQSYYKQQSNGQQQSYNNRNTSASQPPRNNTTTMILVVILAAVTFPVWAGLVAGFFGLAMGFFGIMIGIVATLFGLTIGGLVGGFAVLGAGVVRLCTGGLATGLLMMGIGALMVAVGILFLILGVLFCGQFLPWLLRGFVKICRMPFQRRKEGCRI